MKDPVCPGQLATMVEAYLDAYGHAGGNAPYLCKSVGRHHPTLVGAAGDAEQIAPLDFGQPADVAAGQAMFRSEIATVRVGDSNAADRHTAEHPTGSGKIESG